MGSFCTAVNCMDGRVQLPVMNYMVASFGTGYVDSVTESGPVRYLAECQDSQQAKSILERVDLSVDVHGSRTVAIVAHHGCAGNQVDKKTQLVQLEKAVKYLKSIYKDIDILGLWVDENWQTQQICKS